MPVQRTTLHEEDVRVVRSALRLLVAPALLLCVASTGSAQAEDANVARARELFQRGVEAYDRGVYFEALQAFQEAYRLQPHASVRVNIANCYDKLDRPAEAIRNFEQFLGSGAGTPAQQEEVVQALPALRKRVGRLVLRVSPQGARVVIDNADELRAPIREPISLKVGRHQLTASLDGHETAMRVVDIHSEETTELDVHLLRLDSSGNLVAEEPTVTAPVPSPPAFAPDDAALAASLPPLPDDPKEADAEEAGVPPAVWAAGSITVAALLTSIVTGQLALAADREFNGELAAVRNMQLSNVDRARAWSSGLEAADRAQAYAITTDVLLSTAVVGAVLTTVLYLNHTADAEAGDSELEATAAGFRARF